MNRLSLIIPLYNRPEEIKELLESLVDQRDLLHEVIIVEDGSNIDSKEVVDDFSNQLPIKYFFKPNSGPGQSRNYGAERATGDYLIFLDSDCIIPEHYLQNVHEELKHSFVDAFGGPDRAHESFTPLQKAINYAMTSFFTTGGIRGNKSALDKFYPRSFNMGYTKDVYNATNGFGPMRFGEDIDMSMRLIKMGFKTRLFPEAYVFHKRRTNFRQFFKQVFNSGMARIHLHLLHPGSLKPVHILPAVFTLGVLISLFCSLFVHSAFLAPIMTYAMLIYMHSTIVNESGKVGLLSVPAAFIQLMGYGLGFLNGIWVRLILKKDSKGAFVKNFYK